MYSGLLLLHSWLRWVILILGLAAIVAARGARRDSWPESANKMSIFFTSALDLQLLLGLALYFAATAHFKLLRAMPSAVMVNRVERFWAVEHEVGMLLALVLVHVGRVKVKRGTTAMQKRKAAIGFFSAAVVLMLLSIPWPFLPYGRPLFRLALP
jgi:hypothetical protein